VYYASAVNSARLIRLHRLRSFFTARQRLFRKFLCVFFPDKRFP
jgi:hypothetical protein